MNRSKNKGRRFEHEVAKIAGGKRAPLSGAIAGQGDILIPQEGIWRDWIIEAKRRRGLGAVSFEAALLQAERARGIGDPRKPLVVAREDHGEVYAFCRLSDLVQWAEALADTGKGLYSEAVDPSGASDLRQARGDALVNLRPRIYIAGALSSENGQEQKNVDRATDAARSLFAEGWAPLCPHWSWYAEEAMGISYEDWLMLDLPWVAVADAVYRLEGASLGAEREVNLAHQLGIPVMYERDGIPAPGLASPTFVRMLVEGVGVGASTRKGEASVGDTDGERAPGNTPSTILDEAKELVCGDRQDDYGHPLADFSRTAGAVNAMFADFLRQPIGPEHIPIIMNLVKCSREMNRPKRDNAIDGAGYWATLELVREKIGGW